MGTMYWIITLANVGEVLGIVSAVAFAVGLFISIVTGIMWKANNDDKVKAVFKPMSKMAAIAGLVLLATTFIPSKQDLYVIYGVGSTIDYLKNSEEAKKLPDNAVRACNAYLESIAEELPDSTATK